jgi:NAD-dependent deacetylase
LSDDGVRAAQDLLRGARSCVVLSGAGMSAESGVPTFRDALTGEWSKFDPMRLASREGFSADPAFVWRWYAGRRARLGAVQPNAGHFALVGLEQRFVPFAVVTQNVDGLHARAGSARVLELHGNLLRTKCLEECGVRYEDLASLPAGEPPRCPGCGGLLRPDVVWFGEMLDPHMIDQALALAAAADVMVVVGTSGVVYPAAGLPQVTRERGGRVVVVNPNESDLDDLADVLLRGTAATMLPRLFPADARRST